MIEWFAFSSPIISSHSVSSCHQCLLLRRLNPSLNLLYQEQHTDQENKIHESRRLICFLGKLSMHRVAQFAGLQLLFAVAISIPVVFAKNDSIYEVLRAHALPMGLLPKGVKEFSVNVETGEFSVFLNQSCKAKYESELHYEANITGTIGYGSIGGLSGISAQELFLWFPVKGIRVDIPSSGVIYFDVGVVRKQYSMSLFDTPKDCVAVPNEAEFHRGNKVQASMLRLYEVDHNVGRNNV